MSQSSTKCPSPAELSGFVAGQSVSRSADDIARHLDTCDDCLSAVDLLSGNSRIPGSSRVIGFEHSSELAYQKLRERLGQTLDTHSVSGATPPQAGADPVMPRHIGRYRVIRQLGSGGFGAVYAAHDPQLNRDVAIKIPHRQLLSGPEDIESWMAEARAVATLDHPHIVPVYDVASTDDFPFLMVSKLVDGTCLSAVQQQRRPNLREIVDWMIPIAEAAHYAHKQRITHRDIKPGNIIIDGLGAAHLIDFGLALQPDTSGCAAPFAGTPAFMSPEQARGESHRVDGRSDVFGLGVVLYTLVTGQRPFTGATPAEALEQIEHHQPKPFQQHDLQIPRELDWICGKAMAKRITDRYQTAAELAADLDYFRTQSLSSRSDPVVSAPNPQVAKSQIVPRGLRAFDKADSEFFLQLLPGPFDRNGLPESIRFWKSRIESTEPDGSFNVGLIYGPSGSGKSSLVKAGLLPRLSNEVTVVYVEATAAETESHILSGLRHHCHLPESDTDLVETMSELRQGLNPSRGRILIVVDQFEQWLHARPEQQGSELVQALRQCDGDQLMCLLVVRDDFWMAVSRFMLNLEIPLLEGQNCGAVHPFSRKHARKVLDALGRAYGALPQDSAELAATNEVFLEQAVDALSHNGSVNCVRLILFAEMMKDAPWTVESLVNVGGIDAVGVTFLDRSFSDSSAPPQNRYHQKAARAILNSLLPEAGAGIKGRLKSRSELLQASGYAQRPVDFENLIRILDSDMRLITPADLRNSDSADAVSATEAGYQLAHDYLVPSLRDWLTQKQQETAGGRARIKLSERSELWNRKPESKFLPSVLEWLRLRTLTDSNHWNSDERRMMTRAARFHVLRVTSLMVVAVISLLGLQRWYAATLATNRQAQAHALVTAVVTAPATAVPYAASRLDPLCAEAIPILLSELGSDETDATQRLHATLALARLGDVRSKLLLGFVENAVPEECENIVTALKNNPAEQLISDRMADAERRRKWDLKARLAVVSLYLGDPAAAIDMCRRRSDPIQRSMFIEEFATWHAGLDRILGTVCAVTDGDFRSAMCLALGSVAADRLSAADRTAWKPVLENWYLDPDAAIHSAAGWTMHHWDLEIKEVLESSPLTTDSHWVVNSNGMTMVKIQPGTFTRTDSYLNQDRFSHSAHEDVVEQEVRITKSFLISDREVTRAQFLEFVNAPDVPEGERPTNWVTPATFAPSDDHPAQKVAWFHAIMYCNWLSRREGLTPCYQGASQRWGMIHDADGYRLPTEAEFEYVCRAGTDTTFCFGNSEELLDRYSVVGATQPAPGASKLPNGWGIFDLHGNLYEWCMDWQAPYGRARNVTDPRGPELPAGTRILRGGSFSHGAIEARSTHRSSWGDHRDFDYIGFRVARTPGLTRMPRTTDADISDPPRRSEDRQTLGVVRRNARWLYSIANGYHVNEDLRVGDFDGDGRSDVFKTTGELWQVADAATAEWRTLAAAKEACPELRFGDFNGDGRTDVMKARENGWWIQTSPNWGNWQQHNSFNDHLADIRFGDFDGDGQTDAFRASGLPDSVWEVSYGCSEEWRPVKRSRLLPERLAFGDFDGDGRTDVFHSGNVSRNRQSQSENFVWWAGRGSEVALQRGYEMKWRRFGDFNGNGTTDTWVTINKPSKFCESLEGAWNWGDTDLRRSDNVALGDFNGDGLSDVFRIEEEPHRWVISYGGLGPSCVVRGDDPKKPGAGPMLAAPNHLVVTTVNDTSTDGPGSTSDGLSLRTAIKLANANGLGLDRITFDPALFSTSQTFILEQGPLHIASSVSIDGPGQELLTIDANDSSRVILVDDNDLTRLSEVNLSGITLMHGFAADGNDAQTTPADHGGAIFSAEDLTLANSTVTSCVATATGGGISSVKGRLVLRQCTIHGNSAGTDGGGIAAVHLTVAKTLISKNAADRNGGGIVLVGADMSADNCTVIHNVAGGNGGAIYSEHARSTLTSCTIAKNSADRQGGGICHINIDSTTSALHNVIVAGNSAGENGNDIHGLVWSRYSLIQNSEGTLLHGKDNTVGLDPGLSEFADHGGCTKTLGLNADSPVIDAGDPYYRPDHLSSGTDQRGSGYPRVVSGTTRDPAVIDIGAFEYSPPPTE